MKFKETVKMVGITAMLQHNSRLANPMDEAAILLKTLTDKGGRNKTAAHYEAIAKAEFFGGLIMDDKGNFIIPESQIEAMIRDSGWNEAKISKTVSVGSICVDEPFVLTEFEGPSDPKKRFGDKNCMDQRLVVIGSKKVLRTRPMFKGWVAEGVITYDAPYTKDKLLAILEVCGDKGVGDYRPKFGRFNVEFL